jgi:CheY-like chemotaxis protein
VRVDGRQGRGRETILVAEDEPSLRALVRTTLEELGYKVVTAPDGEQAVRVFQEQGHDVGLVLMDVVMPKLGAREAYERISEQRPGVRVLLMTGYAPESTRLGEIVDGQRVQVLEKPFTPRALAAKVRSVLNA